MATNYTGVSLGTWSTAGNWSNGVPSSTNDANFAQAITGNFGINVNTSITAVALNVTGGSGVARWFLCGSAIGTAGTSWTVSSPTSITVNDVGTTRGDLTIQLPMTGSATVTKLGAGGMLFDVGARTWSGTLDVQAGTVGIQPTTTAGTGLLQFNTSSVTTGFYNSTNNTPATVSNNVTVTGNGSGTWLLNNGNSGLGGTLTLSGSTITFNNPGTIQLDADAVTISGAIGGSGGFTKTGAATLTLSGTNTFTGTVTSSAGTLSLGTRGLQNATWYSSGAGTTTFAVGSFVGGITGSTDKAFGTSTVTLGGDGSVTVNATWTGGFITNNTPLVKQGPGTQTLVGNSSGRTTAATTINGGAIQLNSATGLYASTGNTGTITVASGASLILNGVTVTNNPLSLTGTLQALTSSTYGGTVTVGSTASFTATSGTLTLGALSATETAGGTKTLTFTGTVDPTSLTFSTTTVGGGNITLTGSGTVSNARDLSFSNSVAGGGTLYLDVAATYGAITHNSFNNVGTISVSKTTAIGGTGTITTVAGSFTLQFLAGANTLSTIRSLALSSQTTSFIDVAASTSVTMSGVITSTSGSTLGKTSSGTLTLSGSNTGFTETLTVYAGTLIAANANALGATNGGAALSVQSGATLQINTAVTHTSRDLALSGTGLADAGSLVLNHTGTSSFATITVGGSTTYIRGTANATLSASINQSGQFIRLGAASGTTLTLTGGIGNTVGTQGPSVGFYSTDTGTVFLSSANTFPVGSTFNLRGYGTLKLGNASALGSSTLAFASLVSGTVTAIDASTTLTVSNALTVSSDVTFTGTAALTLSGAASLTASAIVTVNGSTSNPLTLSGVISSTGLFGLTKAGANTLVLSGNNTYTGGTTVNTGTLQCGHVSALGVGNVSLSTGTKLQTLTAGGQNGKLTIIGNLTNTAGASLHIGG